MKIISVVGARPNFMKIAPFIRAIEQYNTSLSPAGGGTRVGFPPLRGGCPKERVRSFIIFSSTSPGTIPTDC